MESRVLDFLIATVGKDRVVSGSDLPFNLCTYPPTNVGNEGASILSTESLVVDM